MVDSCPVDLYVVHSLPPIAKSLKSDEFLIIIHFAFKNHLPKSFFSRKKLLFVGGSLAGGSRQQAAGSRQQAAGSRQQAEVGGQGENPNTQIPNPKQIQNSNFPIFKTVMFGFNIVFEF
ncbi:MAG: hypothetical protein P8075_11015 [Deltaproteobacteria bacterium]